MPPKSLELPPEVARAFVRDMKVFFGAYARACAEADALLFKAKATRDKDQQDFDRVLPELGAHRARELRQLLQQVHPGHPWVRRLAG